MVRGVPSAELGRGRRSVPDYIMGKPGAGMHWRWGGESDGHGGAHSQVQPREAGGRCTWGWRYRYLAVVVVACSGIQPRGPYDRFDAQQLV